MEAGILCTISSWCVMPPGHNGLCREAFGTKRKPFERPPWDINTPDPRNWRDKYSQFVRCWEYIGRLHHKKVMSFKDRNDNSPKDKKGTT